MQGAPMTGLLDVAITVIGSASIGASIGFAAAAISEHLRIRRLLREFDARSKELRDRVYAMKREINSKAPRRKAGTP